eukprot:PLAT11315.1.p1 GENE.PLAT11315.1~~PLAT11315.1.p1  ORF type:complete len:195 (-),score=122.55 PLAT11315.1:103-687(-)
MGKVAEDAAAAAAAAEGGGAAAAEESKAAAKPAAAAAGKKKKKKRTPPIVVTKLGPGERKVEADDTLGDWRPGQRYRAPPRGEGTRVFYETLHKKNPESKLALGWCLEYGLLEQEQAIAVLKEQFPSRFAKLRREQAQQAALKATAASMDTGRGKRPRVYSKSSRKSKRAKVVEAEVDAGLSAGGSEGIGRMAL